jgi:hypothetical protein
VYQHLMGEAMWFHFEADIETAAEHYRDPGLVLFVPVVSEWVPQGVMDPEGVQRCHPALFLRS